LIAPRDIESHSQSGPPPGIVSLIPDESSGMSIYPSKARWVVAVICVLAGVVFIIIALTRTS
jgi:hypothetical protein